MVPYFAHQAEYLASNSEAPGWGLWWEMGTAKTRAIIENMKWLYLHQKIDGALILAESSVYLNWPRQFALWWPQVTPLIYTSANTSKSIKAINKLVAGDAPKILLLNVEALSREMGVAVHTAASFVKELKGELMVVVDESNLMGSPKSARTKVIRAIGRSSKYRRLMSGTPGVETPLKMYPQLEFISPGCTGMTYTQYAQFVGIHETVYAGNRRFQQIVGYRRLDWVKKLMNKYGSFVAKTECHDLPPKLYETWNVVLDSEHMKKYRELLLLGMTELKGGLVLPGNAMDKLYQLHNMVTGFARTEFGVEWFSRTRLKSLIELLGQINGKAIIYSPSRVELEALDGVLSAHVGSSNIARFHGGIDPITRNRDVDRFQQDSSCKYFLANQRAAGYSLDLTAASYEIYFRNAYSLDIRLQSEDRAHRTNQTKAVTIIDMVSPGTVDVYLLEALRNKYDIAAYIIPFLKRVFENS